MECNFHSTKGSFHGCAHGILQVLPRREIVFCLSQQPLFPQASVAYISVGPCSGLQARVYLRNYHQGTRQYPGRSAGLLTLQKVPSRLVACPCKNLTCQGHSCILVTLSLSRMPDGTLSHASDMLKLVGQVLPLCQLARSPSYTTLH